MTKTEVLDRLARDGEERLLLARALDKLETARRKNIPACTGFLSPAERVSVENLIAMSGHPAHLFFGGYEGAERTVCVFLPDWQEPEDFSALALADEGPVAALRCTFRAEENLTHRDFLGSILGQGITREKVGDLLVGEGKCDLIVLRELSDYLLQNLDSAGRVRLKVSAIPLADLEPPVVQVKHIRDTVATPGWTPSWPPPFPPPVEKLPTSSPPAGCSSTTGSVPSPTSWWRRETPSPAGDWARPW